MMGILCVLVSIGIAFRCDDGDEYDRCDDNDDVRSDDIMTILGVMVSIGNLFLISDSSLESNLFLLSVCQRIRCKRSFMMAMMMMMMIEKT